MSNIHIRVLSAILIGLLFLHIPAIWAQPATAQITGSILYRERVALPADAAINVQLQDVSIADVAAQVVAETMLNAEGRQLPIPFALSYDPAQIDPSHRYSVRATIRSGDGMLMFATAQAYPVITHGAPSKVSLVLRTVGHGPKPGTVAKPQQPAPHTAEPVAPSAEKQPPSESAPASSTAADAAPPVTSPAEGSRTVEKSSTTEENKPALQAETSGASSATEQSETPATEKPEEKATQQPSASVEAHASAAAVSKPEPSVAEPQSPQPASEAVAAPPAPQEAKAAESAAAPDVAEPAPQQPESKRVESQPRPQEAKPTETPAASVAEAQPQHPASTPVEAQASPQEAKPTEQQAPLPDSPSTVAGLTAPDASPEQPEPEPEAESRPARPKAETPLADTQWKLIQLGGFQVVVQSPDRPLTLAFSPEGRRIAGSAGCHSYIGTFTDDHGRLTLNPGDMAAIGCSPPIIRREQKFVAAMHDADGYRVTGDYLVLTSKGKTLAKFKNQLAP